MRAAIMIRTSRNPSALRRVAELRLTSVSHRIRGMSAGGALLIVAVLAASYGSPGGPPAPAAAAGFAKRTFSAQFTRSSVDLANTRQPGKKWYLWRLANCQATADEVALRRDGSAALTSHCGPGATLASATRLKGGFVGTAFGGGGYFEAEIAFDRRKVDVRDGWPAWWAMAAEHLFDLPGSTWRGMPIGYRHFIEVDILEAHRPEHEFPYAYAATVLEWYGEWNKGCSPRRYCVVRLPYSGNTARVPAGTDFKRYHRVGMRWLTASEHAKGEVTFWFDERKVGPTVRFDRYRGERPPAAREQLWAFGKIDEQHLVLILGAGRKTPLNVRRVTVWQGASAQNLVR